MPFVTSEKERERERAFNDAHGHTWRRVTRRQILQENRERGREKVVKRRRGAEIAQILERKRTNQVAISGLHAS